MLEVDVVVELVEGVLVVVDCEVNSGIVVVVEVVVVEVVGVVVVLAVLVGFFEVVVVADVDSDVGS